MKTSDIRTYIEDKGEILIEGYDCEFNKGRVEYAAGITAMRLGRLLASDDGRNTLKAAGYNSGSVIIIAEGRKSIAELEDAVSKHGYPAYIAFTENDTLAIGVIIDKLFSEEDFEVAEKFQKVVEDTYYACKGVKTS